MFKVLYALKDAYVQNRVVNGTFQVSGNVGQAGSLDLFKLYGYTSTMSGSTVTPNVELSRLLIHFDLQPLRDMVAAGQVDPGNASFSCRLHLYDVYGGQPTPDNFTVTVNPLSASFDEGHGKDVVYYSDYDVCNWFSSSLASGSWIGPGCSTGGVSPSSADYFTNYQAQQTFVKGTEDLDVDITQIVSATLAGLIPDAGFRIAFAPSLESDSHSYFVKRFASKQAYNAEKHPKLFVRFDSSIQDDTQNFFLDSPSYLFLYNYVLGAALGNLMSASMPVTGRNSLLLTLQGTFPQAAPGVVSSSVGLVPQGLFTFGETSDVVFAGQGNFSYVTQSVVNAQTGDFTFGQINGNLSGSNIAFTGFYSGTLNGITGSADDLLLVGQATGTYVSPVSYGVLSGVYYYRRSDQFPAGWDIHTPILTGSAMFTGTIQGLDLPADTYILTGTFAPAQITSPQEMPYLFSGTYVVSSTIIFNDTSGSQLVGQLTGTYSTTEPFVPSGTFYLPNGTTPVLSGVALFTGTLAGVYGEHVLTGTFAPDGPFLFSASYFVSQTLRSVPFVARPFLPSQLALGNNFQTGIYSASVLLASYNPDLEPQWQASGSVSFIPVWGSLDGTVPYLTGSVIKAYPPARGPQSRVVTHLTITIIGLADEYDNDTQRVLRVNIWDYTQPYLLNASRLPVELPGIVIRDVHYQIRDNDNGSIAVPFDFTYNSTRLSNASQHMFFTLDTSNLTPGHSYVIDIMVVTDGAKQLYRGASSPFRVVDWE